MPIASLVVYLIIKHDFLITVGHVTILFSGGHLGNFSAASLSGMAAAAAAVAAAGSSSAASADTMTLSSSTAALAAAAGMTDQVRVQ